MSKHTAAPHSRQRPHSGGNFSGSGSLLPCTLSKKYMGAERAMEDELTAAIEIARETRGPNDPLLKAALASLRGKERRRAVQLGLPADELTALVCAGNAKHEREMGLAALLARMLGERPKMEARLPGFGQCRVDMLFPANRLVVEENGRGHRRACDSTGLYPWESLALLEWVRLRMRDED